MAQPPHPPSQDLESPRDRNLPILGPVVGTGDWSQILQQACAETISQPAAPEEPKAKGITVLLASVSLMTVMSVLTYTLMPHTLRAYQSVTRSVSVELLSLARSPQAQR